MSWVLSYLFSHLFLSLPFLTINIHVPLFSYGLLPFLKQINSSLLKK
jgi:hypothetical protein